MTQDPLDRLYPDRFWGFYDNRRRGLLSSTLIHVALVLIVALFFSHPRVQRWAVGSVELVIPIDLKSYIQSAPGGGSGGERSPLPASRGRAPRFDVTQLTPPSPVVRNPTPRLAVEPTLIGPQDLAAPRVELAVFGDPLANVGPPSGGPGADGGIGPGRGGGVGPGAGPGLGPGEGGGMGGVYRPGAGVTAPRLLSRVDPDYSEQARKAKWQGVVVLLIEVWPDGNPHNIRVVQALGMGLDEKAIEAVQQWRFTPGRKDGLPVKVQARVEVNFRLL